MATRVKFKQTEIGEIPEDWDVKRLGDIADMSSGGTPLTSDSSYYGGRIPWVVIADMTRIRKYLFETEKNITELGLANSSARLFKKGTLLFAMYASIGKCAIVKTDVSCNQAILGITSKNIDTEYLFYYLAFNEKRFLQMGQTGTQNNLNKEIVQNLKVPYPKLEEQSAIASVLSDTDILIEHLDKLIEKKKNIKQGAMQELLTGKRRLPGFKGEWKTKTLRQLTQIPVTDGPHLTPEFLSEGIPFLSVNNIVNNQISLIDLRYISRVDHEEFCKKCRPKKGDILLGKAATVGTVAVIDLDYEINIWSPLALIRINNTQDNRFIYYSLQTSMLIDQIKLFTNSSSQGNIGMCDIEKLEFKIPIKDEQLAIAQILSDMDSEIEELEQKKDKYLKLKEGMMQQLLTGRIRLKC